MAHRAKVEPGGCIQTDPYNPEWQLFVVEAILSPPASIAGVRLYRSPSSLARAAVSLDGRWHRHSSSHLSNHRLTSIQQRIISLWFFLFCLLTRFSISLPFCNSQLFSLRYKEQQTGAQQETSHSSSHPSCFHLAGWLIFRKPQKADIC